MLRLLILAAALAAGPAMAADMEARSGSDSVRITDKPCPLVDKLAERVPQGMRGFLRLALTHWQGQDYTACWVPSGSAVILLYEDGDTGAIPISDLKAVPEA